MRLSFCAACYSKVRMHSYLCLGRHSLATQSDAGSYRCESLSLLLCNGFSQYVCRELSDQSYGCENVVLIAGGLYQRNVDLVGDRHWAVLGARGRASVGVKHSKWFEDPSSK